MCAVVHLRALMARQAARLITNPPIRLSLKSEMIEEDQNR
jgi:hypothetical protein